MRIRNKICAGALALVLSLSNIVASNATGFRVIKNDNKYKLSAELALNYNKYYDTVIIVNTDKSFADGLSASGLAGEVDAPILLVSKDNIDADVLVAISKADKAYIIGGTNAISKNVEDIIKRHVSEVERIEGTDRIETSYKVYCKIKLLKKEYGGTIDDVYLVNGWKGEADAMSIAHTAFVYENPVILTNGKTFALDAKQFNEVYCIGGNAVIDESLVKATGAIRLGGSDRFETNKQILARFHTDDKEFYVVNGWSLTEPLLLASSIGYESAVMFADNNSDKSMIHCANDITLVGNVSNKIANDIMQYNNVSQERKNAVTQAYMWSTSDVSKKEVAELLSYDGFSSSDINYAMNILKWDFNMNCLRSARMWINECNCSYKQARELLKESGYTVNEIEYAMKNI